MKKNTKVNKNIIVIGIVLSIFLLIVILEMIIYYSFFYKGNDVKSEFEYINSNEWNGELYPEGMPNLYRNYSGSLTCQNIGKSFDYVVNDVIPRYAKTFKDSDENAIKNYFDENNEAIALEVGIKNNEDFIEFVNKIKTAIKNDEIEFESFYVDAESIKKNSSGTRTDLCINYKNCDELVVNVKINGYKNANASAVEYK